MLRLEDSARPFRLVREPNPDEISVIPIRTVRNMTAKPCGILYAFLSGTVWRGVGPAEVRRYGDRSPKRNALLHLHTRSLRGNVLEDGLHRPEFTPARFTAARQPIHSHQIRAQEPVLKPPFDHALISADLRPGFSRPRAPPRIPPPCGAFRPLLTSDPSSRASSPDSLAGIRVPPQCRALAPPPQSPLPRAP
jgi:hypothetical protein